MESTSWIMTEQEVEAVLELVHLGGGDHGSDFIDDLRGFLIKSLRGNSSQEEEDTTTEGEDIVSSSNTGSFSSVVDRPLPKRKYRSITEIYKNSKPLETTQTNMAKNDRRRVKRAKV